MAAASHTACPAEILSPQPSIAVAGALPNENGVSPRLAETQQLVAEVAGEPRGTTGAGHTNVASALALPVASASQPDASRFAGAWPSSSSSPGSVSAHAADTISVSRDRLDTLHWYVIQVCEELDKMADAPNDPGFGSFQLMRCKQLLEVLESRDRLRVAAGEDEEYPAIERLVRADTEQRVQTLIEAANQLHAELYEVQQRCAKHEHDAQQARVDCGEEVSRLMVRHCLALCAKDLQMNATAAKTHRAHARLSKENKSLRIANEELDEELSTVSTALAEHMRERDVRQLKVAELNEAATFNTDRVDELERTVMACESEAPQLHTGKERSHAAHASALKALRDEKDALRTENDALRTERDQSRRDADDKQHPEAALRETYAARGNALRCQTPPSRRSVAQPRADAAPEAPAAALPSSTYASPRTSLSPVPGGGSHKRARIENMRFVAVDLSDGQELARALKNMPGVTVVECQPSMPVPPNLTHLIADGASTVELMAALAAGCWVLPRRYVLDSVAHGALLPEAEYGIRHAQPPLRNKRVVMTDHFRLLESCDDVVLLLRAGGAIVGMDPNEADIVLCRSSELASVRHGMNWEGLIQLIYPVKITTEP